MTTPTARGRLGQDLTFTVDELAGARLRSLRAAYLELDPAPGRLLLLYLITDRPGVHRLFLDVGVAFWEDWGENVDEDDDSLHWRDLGAQWGLVDGVIARVEARAHGPEEATRVEIDLGPRGCVVLEPIDPAQLDGPSRVRLAPPTPRP